MRTLGPAERTANAEFVLAMRRMLRGFLDGRIDREGLARFGRERYSEPSRRLWGAARAVLDSLAGADDLAAGTRLGGDGYVVREVDVQAYLRWLTEGERFFGDEQPLACLDVEHGAFIELVGVEPIRFWWDGLGWTWSLEFCSPATGRTFGVLGNLELGPSGIDVRKAALDTDAEAALADLVETLGLAREEVQTSLDLDAVTRRERF